MTDTASRAGFIALIGEPNAGKSTLLNQLVGAQISIVTHKVQTTRIRIRGIAMRPPAQLIFIDTPGLFQPNKKLEQTLVSEAWAGVSDADSVALLVEATRGVNDGVKAILEKLKIVTDRKPIALVINKIDRVPAETLLKITKDMNDLYPFEKTFMVSALKGHGVEALADWFAQTVPEGEWLYPEDHMSDMSLRILSAEITREKLMTRLHQELPYQLTVDTEKWTENKDGSVRIDQIIYVSREGHRGIVLGKKGETIKGVSMAARLDINRLVGQPIHLFLKVKVDENWLNNPDRYVLPDRGNLS